MPSRLSYVWLSQRRGLTPFNMAQLLCAFGSPDAVFAADRQALTSAPCALRKAQVDALCDKDSAPIRTGCAPLRTRRSCCMCAAAGRTLT